jgi:predicted GNAT family acetyltransferase
VQEDPEMTWITTGTPLSFYNGVIRTRLTAADGDAAISGLLQRFQARRQVMSWWVTPGSSPADLSQRLEARGLVPSIQDSGMAVDLLALNEAGAVLAGLTIEPVRDETSMQDWLRTFGRGFELSEQVLWDYSKLALGVFRAQHPMTFYLARRDGEPVATSAFYPAEQVATIEEVSTIPEARGQGIGAAVTLAACRAARAAGYHVAVLYASAMGAPVYRRLGFRDYFTRSGYVWRP